jgi:hypothetical protein
MPSAPTNTSTNLKSKRYPADFRSPTLTCEPRSRRTCLRPPDKLNALALAIFLGIGSAQSVTTMDFLLLDEPVQNLDDVHFLALVTLLKRVALTSQVIISTADKNIAEIIHRQVESTWYRTEQDYAHHKWDAFSPQEGPNVIAVPIRTSAVA